jgi:ATP-binding cassette subfamily A (ABC1) protein 3
MAFSYFMSVFFSVPKTAGDISILFGVIGDFLVQLLLLGYVQEYLSPNNVSNPWLVYLLCLFPSTAFTKMIFGNLSNAQTNIQFSNNSALLMMLFDLVLYFTLYVYLDNVIPNEYGTHKSPFFFLKFGKKDKVE